MKRNPRKVKWTKAYRRLHGKDMTQDSTFKFERKRNRPERYDRNLAENTLKAIKKIVKVRADRESKNILDRMKGNKSVERKRDKEELEPSTPALQIKPYLPLVKVPRDSQENRMKE